VGASLGYEPAKVSWNLNQQPRYGLRRGLPSARWTSSYVSCGCWAWDQSRGGKHAETALDCLPRPAWLTGPSISTENER